LLGWKDPGLTFDVALHAGTLIAVLIYFRRTWVEHVLAAAGLDGQTLRAGDFSTFADLHEITPVLQARSSWFGPVRAYYHLVGVVGRLAGFLDPAAAKWAASEQATCSRYAAVLVDRRMRNNLACSAALRSF
jgi:hypothetical protein